jgi:hypothetical protein
MAPGSPPLTPALFFEAQLFNAFDNLTLFSESKYAGKGHTKNGIEYTAWRATGCTDSGCGIKQASLWAFTDVGLPVFIQTNFSSPGEKHFPYATMEEDEFAHRQFGSVRDGMGFFQSKLISFENVQSPPDPAEFRVPYAQVATLECEWIDSPYDLYEKCQRTASVGDGKPFKPESYGFAS